MSVFVLFCSRFALSLQPFGRFRAIRFDVRFPVYFERYGMHRRNKECAAAISARQ